MMWPSLDADPKPHPLDARDFRNLAVKGRLRNGVSVAQAKLTPIAADLERAYPDTNKNRRLAVRTELQTRMAQDPPDASLIAMLSPSRGGAVRRVRERRGAADQPRPRARP